ncbi:MAG: type I-MYXAN CRISPR-associated protein Cas6/Cmx6 [Dehalococcoidia bacterium]
MIVDVSFQLNGTTIPADHGYPLFAAVSRAVPGVHGDQATGIHPIAGALAGDRRLRLTDRSHLTFRVPGDNVPALLPLAGRFLDIGDSQLHVGVPTIHPLQPSTRLFSRLVVIKGMLSAEHVLDAARRQLETLNVAGKPVLPCRRAGAAPRDGGEGAREPWVRRTLCISDRVVVGYALGIIELTAEESIRVQEQGVGGRRRFGCGVFTPWN